MYFKPPSDRQLRLAAEQCTVIPEIHADSPWGATGFTLKRPANVIGPSVTAYGVGSGSTGTRADLLICDDVVDVRSLHNSSERHRVGAYFENNLMNLLEPEGRFWNLVTPWHGNDLNARLKKSGRGRGIRFKPGSRGSACRRALPEWVD